MVNDKDVLFLERTDEFKFPPDTNTKVYDIVNRLTHCRLQVAVNKKEGWATIYVCENKGQQGVGHMDEMFHWYKDYFTRLGYTWIGCTKALKPQITHLCQKYGIVEYAGGL